MKVAYLYHLAFTIAILHLEIAGGESVPTVSFTKAVGTPPALNSFTRDFASTTSPAISTKPAVSVIETEIQVAPTDIRYSLLRGGPGAFGASRGGNKKHAGMDIVANQSNPNKETYVVKAVHAGTVAYARMNGSDETDYGYTVIIDHGDGVYTQYSHLAYVTSSGLVKVGDAVSAGATIGYMADLNLPEKSSGNVRADVVKPYDKIQLHFEVFRAKAGRTSSGAISPIKMEYNLIDPTNDLMAFNYKSF